MCWLLVQSGFLLFVIRNEDKTPENEPELCGFGHFIIKGSCLKGYKKGTRSNRIKFPDFGLCTKTFMHLRPVKQAPWAWEGSGSARGWQMTKNGGAG